MPLTPLFDFFGRCKEKSSHGAESYPSCHNCLAFNRLYPFEKGKMNPSLTSQMSGSKVIRRISSKRAPSSHTILLLNHILIRSKRISPLRRRAEGFAVIVAPLSTSAFGGLATGEPSPSALLRTASL